jgi:hypothetical protein
MLYCQMLGGCGNMFFQISTLYALAKDRNIPFCISSKTSTVTHRDDEDEWFTTIFRNIPQVSQKPPQIKTIFREKNMLIQQFPMRSNMEIFGYFQSDRYFKHRKQEIVELFTEYKKELNLQPFNKPTIGIHVRRGDYVKLQHAHVVLPVSYYNDALNLMGKKLGFQNVPEMNEKYTFVIFSDDIHWCRQAFYNNKNIQFMEGNKAVVDLYYMNMCDHNIMANSTFSWFGSYLRDNTNRIIIAPKNWFNPNFRKPSEWQTIYRDDMIVI